MGDKQPKHDDFASSTLLVKTSWVTQTFSLVAFTHLAQNL
jgi:hypothetical protein